MDVGFYVLFFQNLTETHEWSFFNEYEVENMAVLDTNLRNQKVVKVSFTLKPGESSLLIFRQINGKSLNSLLGLTPFKLSASDIQASFRRVKF